jgi:hypothetical protein
MAEPNLIDLSPGAGSPHVHGGSTFVVIDTPTPKPIEEWAEQVVATSVPPPITSEPVLPVISSTPVKSYDLKPTKWAMGLLGPLREATFVGEKNQTKLLVNFSSGLFSDSKAIVTDPLNNYMQPFEIVDASSIFRGEKITVYARNGEQKEAIGKIQQIGCACQGLRQISLGTDAFYLQNFWGELPSLPGILRFVTIFAPNGQPLIHWNGNTNRVEVYTLVDLTILLLILAYESQSRYSLSCQRIVGNNTLELDASSRQLQHPDHIGWVRRLQSYKYNVSHACVNGSRIKLDFSLKTNLPALFNVALLPNIL